MAIPQSVAGAGKAWGIRSLIKEIRLERHRRFLLDFLETTNRKVERKKKDLIRQIFFSAKSDKEYGRPDGTQRLFGKTTQHCESQ